MPDFLPKFSLLYYKHLIDSAMSEFFNEMDGYFAKDGDCYVMCKPMSRQTVKKWFKAKILQTLREKARIEPFSSLKPRYFFIIGSCFPADNLLLKHRDSYFPKKLDERIKLGQKYVLKEHDIKIDLESFNWAWNQIFDELFDQQALMKELGPSFSNVLFIQHRQLDCYLMFKTLKWIFGRSNCVNLHEKLFADKPVIIHSLNELIDMYSSSKRELNKSPEMKAAAMEVKQFIGEKFKGIVHGKEQEV